MRRSQESATLADLPDLFCWTKFGTEAGEAIESILARKDAERRANGGTFLWGIGNAVGPSIRQLVDETAEPRVIFTPMLSRAAVRDVSPSSVVSWHGGTGLDGHPFEVPSHSLVTSRQSTSRQSHYALVCASDNVLTLNNDRFVRFAAADVCNLRSGQRVGSSQVTSVVRRIACAVSTIQSAYRVTFSARLVAPFFVQLTESSPVRYAR